MDLKSGMPHGLERRSHSASAIALKIAQKAVGTRSVLPTFQGEVSRNG